MWKTMKGRRLSVCLIALGACLMLFTALSLSEVPALVEYIAIAPRLITPEKDDDGQWKESPNRPLQDLLSTLKGMNNDMSEVGSSNGVYGETDGYAFISDESLQMLGRLLAVGEGYFDLYPETLKHGRLFYKEELRMGQRVAVITEYMALKLYRNIDATGRKIRINEKDYSIVGVVRGGKRIGGEPDCRVYLPIVQLAREQVQLNTLTLATQLIPGAGGREAFQLLAEKWLAGGQAYNLNKEVVRAQLPARILICILAFIALFALLRRVNQWAAGRVSTYQVGIRETYWTDLAPRAALEIALGVAAYTIVALAGVSVFIFLFSPIGLFPEWIPSILVEPKEIATTFWKVHMATARQVCFQSPRIVRIRFFGTLSSWGTSIMLLGIAHLLYSGRRLRGTNG